MGKKEFFRGLDDAISGGERMDEVEDDVAGYPLNLDGVKTKAGAPVLDFDPREFMDGKTASRLTRSAQFGLAAARLALEDGGYQLRENEEGRTLVGEDSNKVGVLMGTGVGGVQAFEENFDRFRDRGRDGVSRFFTPQLMPNSPAGAISIQFGLKGFNFASISACASSSHSIGLASTLLKDGRAEVALAGGVEALMTPLIFAAFSKIKATTRRKDDPKRASRPFDAERDGFLPGEGAGVVVLETLSHARNRGAEIYAELSGFGITEDAHHITAPDPSGEGAARSMEEALERSGCSPADIDYINAHGTSTPLNDKMETLAVKRVFGDRAGEVPLSSTKSQIGHLMGASGAVEAIASVYAIRKSKIPPTINYENPDPDCDLDYTPNEHVRKKIDTLLSNSFGFGGHNGTLCLTSLNGG